MGVRRPGSDASFISRVVDQSADRLSSLVFLSRFPQVLGALRGAAAGFAGAVAATAAAAYWWGRVALLVGSLAGAAGVAYFQRELARGIARGDAQLTACESIPGFKRAQNNLLCKVIFRSKLKAFRDGKQKVADATLLLHQMRAALLGFAYIALCTARSLLLY